MLRGVYVRLDGCNERLGVGIAVVDPDRQRRVEMDVEQAENGFCVENVVIVENLDRKRLPVGDADKGTDLLDGTKYGCIFFHAKYPLIRLYNPDFFEYNQYGFGEFL